MIQSFEHVKHPQRIINIKYHTFGFTIYYEVNKPKKGKKN